MRISRPIAQQNAAETHAKAIERRGEIFKFAKRLKRMRKGRMMKSVMQQLGLEES